jgi:pyruvate kinase
MPGNRKAKIICTIGPSSSSAQTIADLIHGGMDVARLNFSHGETDEHRLRIERIRRIARALRRPVAILQDLQGPKIRVGSFEGGKLLVREGDQMTLTTRDVLGGGTVIPVTAKTLPRDLRRGETVLFDDGRIRMEVEQVKKFEVICRVKVGGILSDHKGINLPDSELSIRALTEKDEKDLKFGQKMGVDFVALSFVRTAQDVVNARAHVRRLGTPLIAKIEKPQAVENLSQIAEAADGIMLARGDLGVEMPLEQLPGIQKNAIETVNRTGRLVIVATEMLESMVSSSRPTRAEVSDVANAILDGADAVMLSAETAIGRYPVLAVSTMAKVVLEAEKRVVQRRPPFEHSLQISTGVAAAAVAAATQLKISTVVAYTESGYTARIISEFRPRATILALTPNPEVVRRVALYWGVKGHLVKRMHSTDVMLDQVRRICRQGRLCKPGSPVIVVAGVPLNVPGNTNLMTVHRI